MYTITEISALTQHAEQAYKIEKLCFGSECWSCNSLHEALADPSYVFFACFDDSEMVGYINASVVFGEAELNRIAVFPNYREKGIGKQLIDKLINILKTKETSCIRLEVRESNIAAISLYRSMGFEQYAVRKKYYNNPSEDAVMMSLNI